MFTRGEITGNSTDEAYVSNAAAVKRYTGIATSSQQQSQPRFRLIAPDVP
jgi:hypothetical protein